MKSKKSLKNRLKQIDDKNVLLKYEPSIKFTKKEKKEGEIYLKKIGFQNTKFFAFASRSSQFHNEKEDTIRNSDIYTNILAVKFLVSKGYKAIRMGKNETKKIDFENENVIDYGASSDRSDFLDVYLASKFEFMISSSSGITELGTLFRKPKLVVNEFGGIHALAQHPFKWMILLKKLKNLNSGNFLSFEEIYEKKLNYKDSIELQSLGYEIIDNNQFEIKKASENFLNLYNSNNNFNLNEILESQKIYWNNLEKYFGFKNENKTIICPDFFKNNIDLFINH